MLAQRFVYGFLRVLVKISLRLFYRSFTIQGKEHHDLKGPFIVVSNHPNTLMDALIVASILKQRIGFLGNASLFRNPKFAAMLRFFGVIPIYRKQDLLPGETMGHNEDSFRLAYSHLEKGGAFLVFPEGTSLVGRKLLEIKTGTARIGLGYEASAGFRGGVKILPVSINYSSSTHFRTRVHVNLNDPIAVDGFREMHEADPQAAVRALTDEISFSLSDGLVILDDPKQERMFQQALRILRKNWNAAKLKGRERFNREKQLAAQFRNLRQEDPEAYLKIQNDLDQWFGLLDRLGLRQSLLGDTLRKMHPAILSAYTLLLLLLGLPFALVGMAAGYIPYWLSGWLPPLIAKDIEYRAPIMMVLGILLFPLFFVGFSLSFILLAPDGISDWWGLACFFALPVCGWIALEWVGGIVRFAVLAKMAWIRGKSGNIASRLDQRRESLRKSLLELIG